jgi:hypothetical protein
MERTRKPPDAGLPAGKEFKPGKADEVRPGAKPGTADAAAPAQPEPSEDFGRRRDIETADEPVEEHDRRQHDEEAEVGRPA